MNYALYENCLRKIIMQSVIDLGITSKPARIQEIGIIFTLYNQQEKLLKIGYIEKSDDFNLLKSNPNNKLIDKRYGKRREVDLLKITLEEVGYKPNSSIGFYSYDIGVCNILNTLGWPTGNLIKKCKKRYVQY